MYGRATPLEEVIKACEALGGVYWSADLAVRPCEAEADLSLLLRVVCCFGWQVASHRDRATGDDRSYRSTENSYVFLWALEIAIWCLNIMLDALQHIERRARQEEMVQSPV